MSFFRTFILTVVIGCLLIVAMNTAIDPLRYFSDSSIADFEKQTRYRYPGFILNKDYDAIFIGTSMAQNFLMADIDNIFDVKSLLLAVSGGSLFEQSSMVSLALATKKPKKIIWEVYEGALINGPEEVRRGAAFPFYMYDQNTVNDIFYLFNFNNTKISLKALIDLIKGDAVNQDKWLTMDYRADRYQHGCPYFINQQLEGGGLPNKSQDSAPSMEKISRNIDKNLLAIIRDNPQVDFLIYAPPVSLPFQALTQRVQPDKFAAMQSAKKYVYPKLLAEPNVSLFEFNSNTMIAGDINNFRDFMHFSGELSKQLLISMQRGGDQVGDDWYQQLARHNTMLAHYPVDTILDNCADSVASH